ncbi:MAG: cytochrome p450 alkane [Lasallia pustulata]|uniref:Cytochrome p450 alkane n=1 Tax=Lasallia pustulata TaxID=136370 RepID=A0A5M8PY82_9LECA|nr:MAG: cytochrome p450 alkane [Lasallia pustulata]
MVWDFRVLSSQIAPRWVLLLVLGFVALGLLHIHRWLDRVQREKRLEATLISDTRCQDPPRLRYRWPLALDLLIEAFKADQAGSILQFFLSVVDRTGHTFEQVLLGARGVDTNDPKNIESVLSTQFENFGLGARSANFRPLLGHGIFTQDGEPWRTSRELLRPQFMQTRSKSFTDIQEQIEKFLINVKASSAGVVDLQPLFFRLTLDTTMAVLFGKTLDSMKTKVSGDEAFFARAFDQAQHELARRGRLGDLYWLLDGFTFRRSCRIVHEFVDKIVVDALNETRPGMASEEPTGRYVFLTALISKTRDQRVLRDQLINVLLAGRDTTACLLSWTFTLLARHPEIQQRLRNECEDLPSFREGGLPTPAEIKGMKFLGHVLQEVLRLFPSVPVNSRSALKTTTLPTGGGPDGLSPVLVRKGEAVGYCVYAMHRRKDIYGDDAESFRPSRWDPDNKEGPDLKGVGWGYLPFNGGPRVCPGQDFALLEASYFDSVRALLEGGTLLGKRKLGSSALFDFQRSWSGVWQPPLRP